MFTGQCKDLARNDKIIYCKYIFSSKMKLCAAERGNCNRLSCVTQDFLEITLS